MQTVAKLLTRRREGGAHHEVSVCIDWTGITEAQLQFLAAQLLYHDLQARIQKGGYHGVPEFVTIVARDMVHEEPVCRQKYNVPESWKSGEDKPKPKEKVTASKRTSLETLLKSLSADELKTLLT
jgi:hypothetical protein